MYISREVNNVIIKGKQLAIDWKHEYFTCEHLVIAMCDTDTFKEAFEISGGDTQLLKEDLTAYLEESMIKSEQEPIESFSLQQAFIWATQQVVNSGKDQIELDHLLSGIMHQPENYSAYYIELQQITLTELLYEMCHAREEAAEADETGEEQTGEVRSEESVDDEMGEEEAVDKEENSPASFRQALLKLSKYVTNLNELVEKEEEPLVGREDIIERTIQVLCRKQKNNPVHIGEPGVGKTAITKGLARRINEGKVPSNLLNATVFELDLGATLAGTQYRGDFEKRLKKILDTLKKHPNPVIYIDEIHNIVGAGSLGTGSLDASNLLKPYLTQGHIRFIGATTYDEYKKYFGKDKGLVRRFQSIEVKEPTVDETIEILKGLKTHYEAYHGVIYTDEAIEGAVRLSQQYINDRFLPDKAIDLLDEAGAYYRATQIGIDEKTKGKKKQVINLSIIETTLSRICHIPKQRVEKDEIQVLKNLENRLKKQVFGQDEAVDEIVRSIKLSRAGLSDGEKPVASLLFVGPTGVGKTELAKTLADELGVKLIRFDMSEYTEKHTASKLIGSPPGYVGYEEGGLLTDAIRKSPHCILLLDEIEKAHQDIYNILLQVMDYATLTDNQGRKADFRNVILIMTSNAGASNIGKKLVGFGERVMDNDAISEAVKKTFTPEFRNRLTGTITFHHIDEEMAQNITKKQLELFKGQLAIKGIELSFTKKVVSQIAEKGISNEYGAREIARIIESKIKPLLVDEILFGKLSKGGKAKIDLKEEEYILVV